MLPWKTMSESLAMQQYGSVLMSMVHFTPKGHVVIPGLGCQLDHVAIHELHSAGHGPH